MTLFVGINLLQAPLDTGKRHVTNYHDIPPSPRKIIQYEFIDESASIISPTVAQERSLSPISRTADSPDSAFTLLLEAANSKTTSVDPGQVLTPPQSPDGSLFKEMRKLSLLTSLTCSATYITRIIGLYTELRADDGFMKAKIYINDSIEEHIIPFNSSLQDHITNIIKGNKDVYFRECNHKSEFHNFYILMYFLHTYTFASHVSIPALNPIYYLLSSI